MEQQKKFLIAADSGWISQGFKFYNIYLNTLFRLLNQRNPSEARSDELGKFGRKFASLFQSAHYAKLFVEAEAGNAYDHVPVDLGQAQPHLGQHDHAGGPARQHRRKRREAARTATDVAEEARKVAEDNNIGDEI